MGAAHCVHRQPAAGQGHQAAEAAAMIALSSFAYSPAQWDAIRAIVAWCAWPDAFINTGNGPLQSRIEVAVSMYRLHSDTRRQQLRRKELITLRRSAETLRTSIVDAISVPSPDKSSTEA